MTTLSTVLFDLDGTLLDTAPDLAFALNRTLEDFGRPALPFERIRPVVSHGGRALIQLGFGLEPDAPGFEERRRHLLDVYLANIARETRLFAGMEEVLDELEESGMPWGVVTNKPGWLTEPLMDALQLRQRCATLVSGDTLPQRKPHPAPVRLACEQAGADPAQCLYVGDAERDIAAGKAAGTHTAAALFGYLLPGDRPEQWGADHLIETPARLLQILRTC